VGVAKLYLWHVEFYYSLFFVSFLSPRVPCTVDTAFCTTHESYLVRSVYSVYLDCLPVSPRPAHSARKPLEHETDKDSTSLVRSQ
jgi:hypothetical protein